MMATASEHLARAREVILDVVVPDEEDRDQLARDEIDTMLDKARAHLTGWLAEDLAEHSARYIGLADSDQVAVLRDLTPGEHLWHVATGWHVTPDEIEQQRIQLTNRKLLTVRRVRCALCNQPYSEANGEACRR